MSGLCPCDKKPSTKFYEVPRVHTVTNGVPVLSTKSSTGSLRRHGHYLSTPYTWKGVKPAVFPNTTPVLATTNCPNC
jgi:hypothetical protein